MNQNEEKLRRVLRDETAGVLPAPDAWVAIRAGVDRHRRVTRWLQFGGAVSAAAVAAVAGVFVLSGYTRSPERPADPAPVTTRGGDQSSAASRQAPIPTPTLRSGPVASGVPAGRLGAGFATVISDPAGAHLALLSKTTGTLLRTLTGDSTIGKDSAAQASPDGKYVYFLRSGRVCEAGVLRVPTAGGGVDKVVSAQDSIIAFALSGDGAQLAALRYTGCGGSQPKTILVVYDVASGKRLRQIPLAPVSRTVPTSLAWWAGHDELAVVRSGQLGVPDRVDLVPMSGASPRTVTGLPLCTAEGISQAAFSADALYLGRDCVAPQNEAKIGHIYRVRLDGTPPVAALMRTTPADQAIGGLAVDSAGGVVFSTVHWGVEELTGPTQVYALDRPAPLFATQARLLGLAW